MNPLVKNGITLRSFTLQIMAIISFLSIGAVLILMLTGHLRGQGTGFEALDDITAELQRKQEEEARQKDLKQLAKTIVPDDSNRQARNEEREAQFREMEKYFVPNTMDFRPLKNRNGLVVTESEAICFPRSNWMIASKFEPYTAIRDYLSQIETIEKMYGSLYYESLDGATPAPSTTTTIAPKAESQPADKSNETGRPITLTDPEEGENKYLMKKLFRKIKFKYMKIRPLIRSLAKGIKTQIPYLTVTMLNQLFPVLGTFPATYQIDALKRLIKVKNNREYYSKQFVTEADEIGVIGDTPDGIHVSEAKRRANTIEQFIDLSQINLQRIATFERIINAFLQNRVDPSFYDSPENVKNAIHALQTSHTGQLLETEEQLLKRVFKTPTTYLVKTNGTEGDSGIALGTAEYMVYTILPLLDKEDLYRVYNLDLLPIEKDGQLIKYKQPYSEVMADTKGRIFEHNPQDYSCITPKPTELCKICYVKVYPKRIEDKCVIDLLKEHENPDSCKKEIDKKEKHTIRIGRRQWAYSLKEPSSLITVCDKEITERKLPKQGIVQIPDNSLCNFKFKNGPFEDFKPFTPGIQLQIEKAQLKDEDNLKEKMIEIKNHFQEYMYIYIPIILSLTGLIFTTLVFLLCCFQQIKTAVVPQKPRIPRRQTNPTTNRRRSQRLELRLLPSYRPAWEIQDV